MAHAVHIAAAVKLSAEDASARGAAPNGEVIHKQQLAYHGNAAHGQGAHLAHHDVVKQGDNVRQGVLHDDGQHHQQHMAVKGPVAQQAFPQRQFFGFIHKSSFLHCTKRLPYGGRL